MKPAQDFVFVVTVLQVPVRQETLARLESTPPDAASRASRTFEATLLTRGTSTWSANTCSQSTQSVSVPVTPRPWYSEPTTTSSCPAWRQSSSRCQTFAMNFTVSSNLMLVFYLRKARDPSRFMNPVAPEPLRSRDTARDQRSQAQISLSKPDRPAAQLLTLAVTVAVGA